MFFFLDSFIFLAKNCLLIYSFNRFAIDLCSSLNLIHTINLHCNRMHIFVSLSCSNEVFGLRFPPFEHQTAVNWNSLEIRCEYEIEMWATCKLLISRKFIAFYACYVIDRLVHTTQTWNPFWCFCFASYFFVSDLVDSIVGGFGTGNTWRCDQRNAMRETIPSIVLSNSR